MNILMYFPRKDRKGYGMWSNTDKKKKERLQANSKVNLGQRTKWGILVAATNVGNEMT